MYIRDCLDLLGLCVTEYEDPWELRRKKNRKTIQGVEQNRFSPPWMSQTVPGGVQSIDSLQFKMEGDAVIATNG